MTGKIWKFEKVLCLDFAGATDVRKNHMFGTATLSANIADSENTQKQISLPKKTIKLEKEKIETYSLGKIIKIKHKGEK